MGRVGPELLGQLFEKHASALRLYARQWCGAPDDVVQEAFVNLARQRSVPERVVPWLYRVVRNGALTALRQDRRRARREAWVSGGDQAWFASADDRIDARHAEALLAGLETDLRAAIVARIWGGLTFDEIARVEGCSVSTAHRRYLAGLAQLLERLDSHEYARSSHGK